MRGTINMSLYAKLITHIHMQVNAFAGLQGTDLPRMRRRCSSRTLGAATGARGWGQWNTTGWCIRSHTKCG